MDAVTASLRVECYSGREFEAGTPVYGKTLTARELRKGLGLGS